jgi:hypothetical protein
MQRNFEPMRKQVETWRSSELTTVAAKMIIYEAFIESELEVPKHLARNVQLAARGNSKCFRKATVALKRFRAKRRYNALLAHGWTLGYPRDRCRNRLVGPGATITAGC